MTRADSGRMGGKASKPTTMAKMHAGRKAQAAKARAEKRDAEPAAGALPAWMSGDKSALPMRPPVKS